MWDTPVCPMKEKFDPRISPAAIVPQGHYAQSWRGGRATGSLSSNWECPLMSLTQISPAAVMPHEEKCSGRLKNCLTAPPWFPLIIYLCSIFLLPLLLFATSRHERESTLWHLYSSSIYQDNFGHYLDTLTQNVSSKCFIFQTKSNPNYFFGQIFYTFWMLDALDASLDAL